MLSVGFEPIIPAFERAKTILAADSAATGFSFLKRKVSFSLRTPEGLSKMMTGVNRAVVEAYFHLISFL
jgi:hypothetical protein